jgi:hypothetical protein
LVILHQRLVPTQVFHYILIMTELNSVLAASLDKLLQKESTAKKEGLNRLYLRDAAMTRMTYILKNSTEKIGVIGLNYNIPKQTDSEMCAEERQIIKQWATGVSSGRFAMVSFLDCRCQNKKNSSNSKSSDSRPIGLMTSSINFPLEYLSSESQLYDECFGRPPAGVLRDALQMLTSKAMEESPMSLRPEQIDLAWRQMKIERLNTRYVENENSETLVGECSKSNDANENVDPNIPSDSQLKLASSRKLSVDMSNAPPDYSLLVLDILMEMVCSFYYL